MISVSKCIKCDSRDTRLERADDGHYRKHCGNCGHVGGPYTSSYVDSRGSHSEPERDVEAVSEQASLGDFSDVG